MQPAKAQVADESPLYFRWREFQIRWQVLIPLLLLHFGAFAAFFFITPEAVLAAAVLWFATGQWGITVGYHRYLAHRSFETTPFMRKFYLFWASLSLQQGPLSWVRIHRAHHHHSDTPADPHFQQLGFFYGHSGWSFLRHKTFGRSDEVKTTPKDLEKMKDVVFFERYHYQIFAVSLVAFYLIGGLPMLLWAGCFRTVAVLHFTWTVNSLTHRFGYRNFNSPDRSENNAFVSLLTWGEGWHNNHHAFPFSAKHGFTRSQIDPTWYWIKLTEKLGLSWNVRLPRNSSPDRTG
jgi:sn-1 stearoyl-lipid 9-desaturase